MDTEKFTDADKQMESWWWSRSYPDPININEKYLKGWQQFLDIKEEAKYFKTPASPQGGDDFMGFGNWVPLGPNKTIGGRILSIAINPKNSNQILIGSAGGGMWVSNDAGANWGKVVTKLPVEGVPSIIIHPNNPKIIYAGTGEVYRVDTTGIGFNVWKTRGTYGVGIIKSVDGGKTWKHVFTKTQGNMFGVQMLQFDPFNKNIVYACCTDGLYKTSDAGLNWLKILNKTYVSDIAINPSDVNIMVASVGNLVNSDKGLYRTTNGGATWSKVSSAAFPADWGGLIRMDNAGSSRLYAGFGTYGLNQDELMLSTDFGATWVKKTNSNMCYYQYWYCNDIAVDPSNIDKVIMCGVNLYNYISTSTTSGTGTRTRIGTNVHSDIHDLIYDPNNSQTIYLASDGGMYKSINNGVSFTPINNGLGAVQFYGSIGVSPTDADNIIGGLQDNGVIKYNGSSWSSVIGSDGGSTSFNPQNGLIVLSNTQNRAIYRSTNSGNSFTTILNSWPGDRTAFMAPMQISKSDPNYIYSATDLWHASKNGGLSFSNDNTSLTNYIDAKNKTALAIGVSPVNSQKAFVSTSPFSQRSDNALNINPPPNLFKTLNAGALNPSFTKINNNLPDRFVLDFAFSSTNDDSVFVTLGGYGSSHVYVTPNGGASWTNIGIGLPDVPFNAIIIDPVNPQILYAGCDLGVFVSNNRGQTWFDFNNGFWDATQIYDLQITADKKLICATHGKGVFKSDLFNGTILPVNLISFTVANNRGFSKLEWISNQEYNFSHYNLERSTDAVNFSPVATIPSLPGSGEKKYYFSDNISAIPQPVIYYRLKMVNMDGRFNYSSIINTKQIVKSAYTILTNPFTDKITANYDLESNAKIDFFLFDINGRFIKKESFEGVAGKNTINMINLSNLTAGPYILNMTSGKDLYKEILIKQ